MVIESVINPLKAEQHPWRLFFVGFLYSSVAMLLSLWVFAEYASLVAVFLTVMACTPLLYRTMNLEEEKDISLIDEGEMLAEHSKAISFLVFLFLGMVVAFSLWYVALPFELSSNLFEAQSMMISGINQKISGNATSSAGILSLIFLNNLKVIIFCILFSFIYGVGAIFILSWNASVIGAAIGIFIKERVAEAAGLGLVTSSLAASFLAALRYLIHGIPEIASYFIAGLAGGIISVAVIRHNYSTKSFERLMFDSASLIGISVFLVFIAALIEVYITPLLF